MDIIPVTTSYLPTIAYSLLAVFITALIALYYYVESSRVVCLAKRLPNPSSLPIIGHALMTMGLSPETVLVVGLQLHKRYGSVLSVYFGTRVIIALTDPKDIEIILSSSVHLDKSVEYRLFQPWLGDGLLITTGDKWRRHRKAIAPTFHMSILKTFVPLFYENSIDLVRRLRDEVGKEFDCHDYLSAVTVDILTETAMGVKREKRQQTGYDYAMAVMKSLRTLMEEQKNDQKKKPMENEIKNNENDKNIAYTKLHYVRDDLDDIDENDIGEKRRLAFLEMMIDLKKNGEKMTDKEIWEEVNTIMFEGHDTTAAGSSFTLCALGNHQDIQARVHEELDTIFGDSDRQCTFQDTLEMKYLERVILESLRLFPPVPLIARKLNEDVQIITGDYILPKDATIVIPQFIVHRAEKYYPNPTVFNPDNFLPEKMQQRHYYAFIPFSAGPRSCVGRKYAMLKLKVLLSTILRNYRVISNVADDNFVLQADIILKRHDGFKIKLEPRKPVSRT
ncbi:Cytochrome P450 4g1 [Camponotus floridanus]|uniref:Cytochrome P450 4g1 n=1 Tax=Camponotus floridanus TaxID=104421 RepID=E2AH96_CAMFO|nr:Cytochrome P450 4g1 [Camponotus floridanus]